MTPEEKKAYNKERDRATKAKYYQRLKLNPEWVAKQKLSRAAKWKAEFAANPNVAKEQYQRLMQRLKADPEAMERYRAKKAGDMRKIEARRMEKIAADPALREAYLARRRETTNRANAKKAPKVPKLKPIKEVYVAPVIKSEPMTPEAAEIRTARQMRNSGERWSVVADYLGVSVEDAKLKLEAA